MSPEIPQDAPPILGSYFLQSLSSFAEAITTRLQKQSGMMSNPCSRRPSLLTMAPGDVRLPLITGRRSLRWRVFCDTPVNSRYLNLPRRTTRPYASGSALRVRPRPTGPGVVGAVCPNSLCKDIHPSIHPSTLRYSGTRRGVSQPTCVPLGQRPPWHP